MKEIVEKIVEAFHPRRIVLFGSRARGEGGLESDVDLFVEMESDKPPRERARDVDALFAERQWSMDIVVCTPQEVQRGKDVLGTLLYSIEREGEVIYERS